MNLSDVEKEKLLPSDAEEQEFFADPDYYPLYTTNREERDWIRTKGLADYIKMRRWYGIVILVLTFLWIIAVLVVVFMQGYSAYGFALPDSVLMLLLGTTTANVIGLFIIVANYLFPKNARDLLDFSPISDDD